MKAARMLRYLVRSDFVIFPIIYSNYVPCCRIQMTAYCKKDNLNFSDKNLSNKLLKLSSDVVYEELSNRNENLNPYVLRLLADYFSLNGHFEGLLKVKNILGAELEEVEFKIYLAQLDWARGNIKHAGDNLIKICDSQPLLIKKISGIIGKFIIKHVPSKGKATLAKIEEFSVLFSYRYSDFTILGTLWYSLHLSQWYCDQCHAQQLLNSHPQIKNYIEATIPNVVRSLIQHNRNDDIQRLLQLVLQLNLINSAGYLLRALFDVHYKEGHTKGCAAIYKCSNILDIKLTSDQIYKYQSLAKLDKNPHKKIINLMKTTNNFKLKF